MSTKQTLHMETTCISPGQTAGEIISQLVLAGANAVKAKRRIERRISKGICTCCNHTFADLQRHMMTKHKGYGLPPGSNPKQIAGAVQ